MYVYPRPTGVASLNAGAEKRTERETNRESKCDKKCLLFPESPRFLAKTPPSSICPVVRYPMIAFGSVPYSTRDPPLQISGGGPPLLARSATRKRSNSLDRSGLHA